MDFNRSYFTTHGLEYLACIHPILFPRKPCNAVLFYKWYKSGLNKRVFHLQDWLLYKG